MNTLMLLTLLWFIWTVLAWIVVIYHDRLVRKYQKRQLGVQYRSELIFVCVISLIPVVNILTAVLFILNIYQYKFLKKNKQ